MYVCIIQLKSQVRNNNFLEYSPSLVTSFLVNSWGSRTCGSCIHKTPPWMMCWDSFVHEDPPKTCRMRLDHKMHSVSVVSVCVCAKAWTNQHDQKKSNTTIFPDQIGAAARLTSMTNHRQKWPCEVQRYTQLATILTDPFRFLPLLSSGFREDLILNYWLALYTTWLRAISKAVPPKKEQTLQKPGTVGNLNAHQELTVRWVKVYHDGKSCKEK